MPAKLLVLAAAAIAALGIAADAGAESLPRGFTDRTVIAGLDGPTTLSFADDGSIYVAELTGRILRFSSPKDNHPVEVADLSTEVHASEAGTGLLGLALDPRFPQRPYIYAGYTFDAKVGGTAPAWHQLATGRDYCYQPIQDPGREDGCIVSSRVSRLTVDRNWRMTAEKVVLEDWCQQFISHSIGTLAFDRRGNLLVSHGDGASFSKADVGNLGTPENRCQDPAGEGGALRAQDMLTPGDPQALNGTIARVNPSSGAPVAGNPYGGTGNTARILGYGFRNPFRFAIQPGTDNLWIADVGWGASEEIDRLKIGAGRDFGWPCYEGPSASQYQALDIPLCNQLYAAPQATTQPWFSYRHRGPVVRGDGCSGTTGAISAIGFERGHAFPKRYDGSLFFADYTRSCIWRFAADAKGRPRRSSVKTFASGVSGPTEIAFRRGSMYYPDIFTGRIHRISYKGR